MSEMSREEATQYMADGVGVLEGTDVDFAMPLEAPCEECGGMVNLSSVITVKICEEDGSEVESQMSEAGARQLILEVGLIPPPVLCSGHDIVGPITTERSRD